MSTASSDNANTVPSSILIVGGGVFGLSTALALTQRAHFAQTTITLLDPHPSIPDSKAATTSSVDTSRIIRADYSDPYYADLAAEAQSHWRRTGDDELGGQGRYSEPGLLLTAERGRDAYVQAALENVRRIEGCGEEGIPVLPTAGALSLIHI